MKKERFMFWNSEVLTRIDAADDLKIAPYHPDMNTTGTPTWIWEVKVDNRLFVRAYSGTRSKWYQAALSQQAGKIRLLDRSSTSCSQNHQTLSLKVK